MEKLLIMSNLAFGHTVFKSRLLLLRQNASAGGKGFTTIVMATKEFQLLDCYEDILPLAN